MYSSGMLAVLGHRPLQEKDILFINTHCYFPEFCLEYGPGNVADGLGWLAYSPSSATYCLYNF